MSLIVDDTTSASTPGEIIIEKNKYLDYVDLKGIKRLVYSLLLKLPINFLHKYLQNDTYIYNYIYRVEQFKSGCLNPTVIVNYKEGIIATFTNLTNDGGDATSVIKISKEPLELIKGLKLQDGLRLPTVALYKRDPEDEYAGAWIDFYPKIANCFTDDLTVCNHLLSRVKKEGWICLEQALQQLEDVNKTGLYYVEIDEDLVNSAW